MSFEIFEFTFAAPHRNMAVGQDGDPGGVVTPVLELSEAFQNERCRVPFADITDDATHYFFNSLHFLALPLRPTFPHPLLPLIERPDAPAGMS